MGRDFSVIKDNVGNDIQDSSSSMATLIGRYVNRRYMDILRRINWNYINEDYSISVSSGTEDYTLPSDFKEELYAYDSTNKTNLKRINLQDLPYEHSSDMNSSGTVEAYAIFNSDDGSSYVRFFYPPNASITVEFPYIARPSELDDDTDEPVLSLEDILEVGATADALRYKRQYAKAKEMELMYESMLANKIWETENRYNQIIQFKPATFNRDNLI